MRAKHEELLHSFFQLLYNEIAHCKLFCINQYINGSIYVNLSAYIIFARIYQQQCLCHYIYQAQNTSINIKYRITVHITLFDHMLLHKISNLKWLLHNFMSLCSQDRLQAILSLSHNLSFTMHFVWSDRNISLLQILMYSGNQTSLNKVSKTTTQMW